MAKDDCMFCGMVPCECNGPVVSKKKVTPASPKDRMKARAVTAAAVDATPSAPRAAPSMKPGRASPDPVLEAVRMLAFNKMLHPTELVKYHNALALDNRHDLNARTKVWKEDRHGNNK